MQVRWIGAGRRSADQCWTPAHAEEARTRCTRSKRMRGNCPPPVAQDLREQRREVRRDLKALPRLAGTPRTPANRHTRWSERQGFVDLAYKILSQI